MGRSFSMFFSFFFLEQSCILLLLFIKQENKKICVEKCVFFKFQRGRQIASGVATKGCCVYCSLLRQKRPGDDLRLQITTVHLHCELINSSSLQRCQVLGTDDDDFIMKEQKRISHFFCIIYLTEIRSMYAYAVLVHDPLCSELTWIALWSRAPVFFLWFFRD